MIFGNELFGGLQLIEQKIFKDERGYFTESYNKDRYNSILYDVNFVQDNESCSKKFVIRGLHYQKNEHAQGKLVRVIKGAVIDFVIDYRRFCPHYGKMLFVYLTPGTQFYIPVGFAHGFISLEDDTIFQYLVDNDYAPELEGGILWNDPELGIDWETIFEQYNIENPNLSEKDLKHDTLAKTKIRFRRGK